MHPEHRAEGRTILITGATTGIGLEAARTLARRGARVLVGARDEARGRALVQELVAAGGQAELFLADLSRMASVREAAARVVAAHPRLDVLVNNAGVALWRRHVTGEGHEVVWATNVLAPFLLTRLLLGPLRAAPRARVINVGSEAHRKTLGLAWDDPELAHGYGPWRAYAQSKLALNLLTREQARREPGLDVNVVHPGAIATGIWRDVRLLKLLMDRVLPPPEEGAGPVIRLATDPALEGVTGRYFSRYREAVPTAASRDDAAAARLWAMLDRAAG